MDKSIFRAYDIRGLYPEEINESLLKPIAEAGAKLLQSGKLIIAHDGRHGSKDMAKRLQKEFTEDSLLSKKYSIEFIGLSTTPMFYFLVIHCSASGGFMVTASHNPSSYNGLKIVKENAIPISGKEILECMEKDKNQKK